MINRKMNESVILKYEELKEDFIDTSFESEDTNPDYDPGASSNY